MRDALAVLALRAQQRDQRQLGDADDDHDQRGERAERVHVVGGAELPPALERVAEAEALHHRRRHRQPESASQAMPGSTTSRIEERHRREDQHRADERRRRRRVRRARAVQAQTKAAATSGANAKSTTICTVAEWPSDSCVETASGSPSGSARQKLCAVGADRLGDQLADRALRGRQRRRQLRHRRAPASSSGSAAASVVPRVVEPPQRPVGLGDRVREHAHLERGTPRERGGAQHRVALHRLDLAAVSSRRRAPRSRSARRARSGSARRAAATSPRSAGMRSGDPARVVGVAVDRLAADHELGAVERPRARRSRRAGRRRAAARPAPPPCARPPRPARRRRPASRLLLTPPSSAWVAATTRITRATVSGRGSRAFPAVEARATGGSRVARPTDWTPDDSTTPSPSTSSSDQAIVALDRRARGLQRRQAARAASPA